MGKQFGTGNHNSISFNIVREKDWTGLNVEALNWGKGNFDGIRLELAKVAGEWLLAGKGISVKYDILKSLTGNIQDQHVPIKVKSKAVSTRESW